MSNQITTASLVAAISAIGDKRNPIVAIADATGGEAVSDGIIKSVGSKLTTLYLSAEGADATRVATKVGFFQNVLRAAPQLPAIVKEATDLFKDADENPRKGSTYVAMRVGVKAALEGRNDLRSAMEQKCTPVPAKDRAAARVVSLLDQAMGKLDEAGLSKMLPQFHALKNAAAAAISPAE